MAEVLLRVAPAREAGRDVPGRLRYGEAVGVGEDKHPWSEWERSNPAWTIIAVPGVPAASLARLLDPYTDEEKATRVVAIPGVPVEPGARRGEILSAEEEAAIQASARASLPPDGRLRAWRFDVFALSAALADAKVAAAFFAAPSWEAAFALGIVVRWDTD